MPDQPTVEDLERFLAGQLPDAERRAIAEAVESSDTLRARLDELRCENEKLAQLRASAAIRLPELEEERIVSRLVQRLGRQLPDSEVDRPGEQE